MKKIIVIVILIVINISCNNIKKKIDTISKNIQENNSIEILIFEFYCIFDEPFIFHYNFNDSSLLIGKNNLLFYEKNLIKPEYHRINTLDIALLSDSILNNFKKSDFENNEGPEVCDGWIAFLTIIQNKEVKNIIMHNEMTDNQKKLAHTIIKQAISYSKNSLNIENLKIIQRAF